MSKQIAKDLLSIRAVFLRPDDPFTWASGIKSPIYCDNRLVLSDHRVRTDVETGLMNVIKENYPEAEVLMGTSTAGIAHAAIVAQLGQCLLRTAIFAGGNTCPLFYFKTAAAHFTSEQCHGLPLSVSLAS